MPTRRNNSSATSAARFRALRGERPPYRRPREHRGPSAELTLHLAKDGPRRIACDFAEPTLRAIHEALLEQIMGCRCGRIDGDLLNRTMIAEHMVAALLGESIAWPKAIPPLTDREDP